MDRDGAVAWRNPFQAAAPPSPAPNQPASASSPSSSAAPAPAPREFHTLTPLPGGRLLLFGGGNGKVMFGDMWILDTENEAFVGKSLAALLAATPALERISGQANGEGGLLGGRVGGRSSLPRLSISQVEEGPLERGPSLLPPSPGPEAPPSWGYAPSSKPWWKGVGEETGLQALRASLGLPGSPLLYGAALEEGEGGAPLSLCRLGKALLERQGLHPAHTQLVIDTARQHLTSCPVEALRLEEVGVMLDDLKLQKRGGLRLATPQISIDEPGRIGRQEPFWHVSSSPFFHLRVEDLRVADIESLQQEYAALFVPL
eukprot:jgi/Botrbrau1/16599/Bobra.0068s0028.1